MSGVLATSMDGSAETTMPLGGSCTLRRRQRRQGSLPMRPSLDSEGRCSVMRRGQHQLREDGQLQGQLEHTEPCAQSDASSR